MVGRSGKATACAERIFEILETPVELKDSPDACVAPPFKGKIDFNNVSLTYGGKTKALENISLNIEPGELLY